MMQKRTFYSLLLISFIAVFAVSSALADSVVFETKSVPRCVNQTATVTAQVTTGPVSAIEIIVEINGDVTLPPAGSIFTFDAGFTNLVTRVVDDTSGVDGVFPDTIRIAAMLTSPSDAALAPGNYVVGRINYHTKDLCTGSMTMVPAVFNYPIPAAVQTQFVSEATSTILPVSVTNGTITLTNQNPAIAAIPNATLFWGQTYTGTAVGSDPDLANGCETVAYAKVSGPATLTVNPTTGAISWVTTGADVCDNAVVVKVTDKCGAVAQTTFSICVQNKPPTITCPAPINIVMGETATGTVVATDPDGGPNALLYSYYGFSGPGSLTFNPVTGAFSWPTVSNNPAYLGTWTFNIVVSDGANTCSPCSPNKADTCQVTINVRWSRVVVEKVHDQHQGQFSDVSIWYQSNIPVAGFDLLLAYDNSAMSLQGVTPGAFITACHWEYFTYRQGPFGNCGNGCPTGQVRIVALAETNNGNAHPICWAPALPTDSVTLADLHFLVSNNRTLDCQYVPVEFFWYDCGDNAFSNIKGDSLIISRYVFGYNHNDVLPGPSFPYYHIEDKTVGFPTRLGAQAVCDTVTPGKPTTWRALDFFNGGVDFVCSESIDARGDINLNNFAYEIADAVMFTNYFVQGLSAFTVNVDGSIAATDANADGLTLTVADLVYLIRVIVGDALPYPKTTVRTSTALANVTVASNGVLSVAGQMGGAFIVVNGNVEPKLLVNNMEMTYGFDGQNTRIVVVPSSKVSDYNNAGFEGAFINVGTGQVVSMDLATVTGEMVTAKLAPSTFALSQNYPNPFNPTTAIEFALPTATNYTLTIYNVQGQEVQSFEGTHEAGYVTVNWNASNNASGVYFYKLTAGTFTATKKMVLLK
ncbi:MAG: T9SS type A sorting domain-containing protein [Candidatus Zixiibacteriota bacterium]